jgi:hypothetical protein
MVWNLRYTGWEKLLSFSSNFPALTGCGNIPGTALQAGRLRVRFPMCRWDFSLTQSFRSTQPLTEMSSRGISWGGGGGGGIDGRCVGLTLPLSCADGLEILGASTSWSPTGLCRDCFDLSDQKVRLAKKRTLLYNLLSTCQPCPSLRFTQLSFITVFSLCFTKPPYWCNYIE